MFEQNNVGVRLENPILTFLKQKENNENLSLMEEWLEEIQKIRDNIEGKPLSFAIFLDPSLNIIFCVVVTVFLENR